MHKLRKEFTHLPFDHLLFTGATSIASHVLHAAADNLTPVTLELGGKSPSIVAQNADLKESARRIAFGKTMNAGQTCVAPDYVLVHSSQQDAFIQAYMDALKQFYPNSIEGNPDYTAIVNVRQFERAADIISLMRMPKARSLFRSMLRRMGAVCRML